MRPSRLRVLVSLAVVAGALVGCGNDNGEEELGDLPPLTDETPVVPEPEDEPEPTPTPAPTPTEQVYVVQQGDTLWGIAQEFGTTVDAIVEANDIDDPEQIFPGDELVIPVDG
jgi:LysM repeat protein